MTFNSVEELSAYISEKLEGEYDYNTHVTAMADVMFEVFNFLADKLGASGFSASCAQLEFIAKARHLEGPFAVIKAEDMLYPQYDIAESVEKYLDKWTPWAITEAKKLLQETTHPIAPVVRERWESLASLEAE